MIKEIRIYSESLFFAKNLKNWIFFENYVEFRARRIQDYSTSLARFSWLPKLSGSIRKKAFPNTPFQSISYLNQLKRNLGGHSP